MSLPGYEKLELSGVLDATTAQLVQLVISAAQRRPQRDSAFSASLMPSLTPTSAGKALSAAEASLSL